MQSWRQRHRGQCPRPTLARRKRRPRLPRRSRPIFPLHRRCSLSVRHLFPQRRPRRRRRAAAVWRARRILWTFIACRRPRKRLRCRPALWMPPLFTAARRSLRRFSRSSRARALRRRGCRRRRRSCHRRRRRHHHTRRTALRCPRAFFRNRSSLSRRPQRHPVALLRPAATWTCLRRFSPRTYPRAAPRRLHYSSPAVAPRCGRRCRRFSVLRGFLLKRWAAKGLRRWWAAVRRPGRRW